MKCKLFPFFAGLFLVILFGGWGNVGHKIINRTTVQAFPKEMKQFVVWKDSLEKHASDPDYRKGSDPTEGYKHYIDIDNFAGFINKGRIPETLDSLIAQYGSSFVEDQGILPYAILNTLENLTNAFKKKDWQLAIILASDLGHYVGDSHMPLHITANYDGQLSGQNGIHSRYESTMIGKFSSEIVFVPDTAEYIADTRRFVFDMIYRNYEYVDSLLYADSLAKKLAGGSTSSNTYYTNLWNQTKGFTNVLFKKATEKLAVLIYTAWVDAGRPDLATATEFFPVNKDMGVRLYDCYPNPYNPTTKIRFIIPENINTDGVSTVAVNVYSLDGSKVATLLDEQKTSGYYETEFDSSQYGCSSGVYIVQLSVNSKNYTKKMLLMK